MLCTPVMSKLNKRMQSAAWRSARGYRYYTTVNYIGCHYYGSFNYEFIGDGFLVIVQLDSVATRTGYLAMCFSAFQDN